MSKNSPLWHICAKTRQTCPKPPEILKANNIYFGVRTIILNSKVKKRPRNFYGANVVWLGVFETKSVLNTYSNIHEYRHTCIRTVYIQAYIPTSMHICSRAYMHAYVQHTCRHTYLLAYIHVCVHTWIHAYMYTHTHTSQCDRGRIRAFAARRVSWRSRIFCSSCARLPPPFPPIESNQTPPRSLLLSSPRW